MMPTTSRAVLALCRSLNAKRILDIGCGNGEFCRRLSAKGLFPRSQAPPEGVSQFGGLKREIAQLFKVMQVEVISSGCRHPRLRRKAK
jgi:hypothetical protein